MSKSTQRNYWSFFAVAVLAAGIFFGVSHLGYWAISSGLSRNLFVVIIVALIVIGKLIQNKVAPSFPPREERGLSWNALRIAVGAFALSWTFLGLLGVLLTPVSLGLGIIALKRHDGPRGFAVSAIVVSAVPLAAVLAGFIYVLMTA